jgi:hypothetical protein
MKRLHVSFLALFASAATMPAQPTVAPTPTDVNANEQTIGGYKLAHSFEVGYRFHGVGGNQDRYRSDVNFGNGIRLLGSTLTLHSLEGHGRLFDELTLTTQGLGNDPYQNAMLRLRHNRFYRYDLNWRLNDYVNPGLRAPYSQHPLNTRRQWQDHDLVLLPTAPVRLLAGVSRNTQTGPSLTTLNYLGSTGDQFPLFSPIDRKQSEYRLGVQVALRRLQLLVQKGWQRYEEQAGATGVPELGERPTDGLNLVSLTRTHPYTGNSPYWRGNLHYEASKFLSIAARFDYASGRRDFRFEEALVADRLGANRTRQTTVTGNASRPVSSGAFTVSLFPAERVTIVNQTAFHQIQMNGNNSIAELNNGAGGATVVRFEYLGIRTLLNTTDVNVQATRWLGVFGGAQYSTRRIRSLQAFNVALPTAAPTEQTNRLKAATFGLRLRPTRALTAVLDGEVGRTNQPFLPWSDKNYHAAGARLQYRSGPFTLSATSRLNYNTNSTSLSSFASKSRNSSISGTWTPSERFSLDAGYSKLHLDTLGGLNYFASGRLTSGSSRYISNIHSTHLLARLVPHRRVDLYLGITRMQDTGDGQTRLSTDSPFTFWQVFPLSYTTPQARLSLRVHSKLAWNIGYQHYSYGEKFLNPQDYRAHTGYTSLLWSF